MAGKFDKLSRLEEVKVVTRSPLVNQRRDHYECLALDPVNLYTAELPWRLASNAPPKYGLNAPAQTNLTIL